jgi:hypothetical protein
MKIVIPSHNRPDSQITLNSIPKSYRENTFIVVRKGEQEEKYKHLSNEVNILALECNDISTKRDAITKHFAGEKIWMVDDDCTLFNASFIEEKDVIKLISETSEEDFYEFIEYTSELLDKYPHGVVRPAVFARGKNYMPYRLNTWAFTNTFLNLKTLNSQDLNYTYSNYAEDVVAFLSVIDSGYDSFCLSKWMIKSQKPGKPGGMTGIRNEKLMTDAAIKINGKFPKHTRLKKGYAIDGHQPTTLIVAPKKKPKIKTLEEFMQ